MSTRTRPTLISVAALAALAGVGCAAVGGEPRQPQVIRLQSPEPAPPAAAAAGRAALPGLSSISRNREVYEVDTDEDEKLIFPSLHDDPLAGSDVPKERQEPFLFPWLMNLIIQDRWRLEADPNTARAKRLRRQSDIDIRDPDPDIANFPNGAYTIPKGRLYIENSPVGFYGASRRLPRVYQWEFLTRYGLTDHLEFRLFSNGLTAQGKPQATTGFSPLAFDFKVHFWEENTRYFIPAMGLETYIETNFGSRAFNGGTQPSLNLLFDQTLPLEVNFEYNFGMTGVQNAQKQVTYQFSFQWSFQRQVVKDFDVFVHGFYNAAALPRLLVLGPPDGRNNIPNVTVVGAGAIWTVNDRLAVFGSYNFGVTPDSPRTIALLGFAVAF